MPRTTDYVNSLTPLRGIAAMMVVVLHFSDEWLPNLALLEHTMLIQKGYLWVDFFFVLSGFIISHVYKDWFSQPFKMSVYTGFMYARFSKIYPVHLTILLGFVVLELVKLGFAYLSGSALATPPFTGDKEPIGILTSVLLIHSMGLHEFAVWNLPSWSMSVEWYTYILFPVLAMLLLNRRQRWLLPSLIACILLVFWFANIRGTLNIISDYGYFRSVLEFSLGMLVYRLYEIRIWQNIVRTDIVFFIAFCSAVFIMHFGGFDAYTIPAFALMILSAAQNRGLAKKILNTKLLIFVGDISYSLYMSHFLLREFIGRSWRVIFGKNIWEEEFTVLESWLALIFQLGLTILFAWIVYTWIERPCQNRIRNSSIGQQFSLRSRSAPPETVRSSL